MKQLLLITFLFVISYSYAQVEKGDLSAAFNISFLSIDGTGVGSINAKVGYYITSNIELGVTPSILIGEGFSQVSFGGYGTYNFLTPNAKLLPYAGAALGLVLQSSKVFNPVTFREEKTTSSDPSFGIYGGSKYFITEKLFADANMNISGSGLGTIFSVNLGVGFLLGKLR